MSCCGNQWHGKQIILPNMLAWGSIHMLSVHLHSYQPSNQHNSITPRVGGNFSLLKRIKATNPKRHVDPSVKNLWTVNLLLNKATAHIGSATQVRALESRMDD